MTCAGTRDAVDEDALPDGTGSELLLFVARRKKRPNDLGSCCEGAPAGAGTPGAVAELDDAWAFLRQRMLKPEFDVEGAGGIGRGGGARLGSTRSSESDER